MKTFSKSFVEEIKNYMKLALPEKKFGFILGADVTDGSFQTSGYGRSKFWYTNDSGTNEQVFISDFKTTEELINHCFFSNKSSSSNLSNTGQYKLLYNKNEVFLNTPQFSLSTPDGEGGLQELSFDFTDIANRLPSRFQIEDNVQVSFFNDIVEKCKIIKVHFSESKILYDIEIMGIGITNYQKEDTVFDWSTRIYNIDSCFVEPADV